MAFWPLIYYLKTMKNIKLTKAEQKIYDSIMANFPATSHESALGIAIQGGLNLQFICK